MTDPRPVIPRQPAPPLRLPLAGGGVFDLEKERPERFTLIVVYRGLHCPICKRQLRDLHDSLPEFATRGVSVIAASSDSQERAERTRTEWDLPNLRLAYDLSPALARSWGLYVSTSRGVTSAGIEETALFAEPALFLIRADGSVYFALVQSMPFVRPRTADILASFDSIIGRDYPARGEVRDDGIGK